IDQLVMYENPHRNHNLRGSGIDNEVHLIYTYLRNLRFFILIFQYDKKYCGVYFIYAPEVSTEDCLRKNDGSCNGGRRRTRIVWRKQLKRR
ncbi:MAG: hypothetical protein AAB133_00860, partial [Pseudomonadota bacterium]